LIDLAQVNLGGVFEDKGAHIFLTGEIVALTRMFVTRWIKSGYHRPAARSVRFLETAPSSDRELAPSPSQNKSSGHV
jgi:hypothetical protein